MDRRPSYAVIFACKRKLIKSRLVDGLKMVTFLLSPKRGIQNREKLVSVLTESGIGIDQNQVLVLFLVLINTRSLVMVLIKTRFLVF